MEISQYTQSTFLDPQERQRNAVPGTRINPIAAIKAREQAFNSQEESGQSADSSALGTLFDTVVDTVNPLQHIPGVSSAYQAATDDTMNPVASMAGGFLFGGPVGLMAGAATSFLEMVTGKSVAQHAVSMFGGDSDTSGSNASQTASLPGDGTPMLKKDQGISLQQYQAFASATADTNSGTGATAQQVAWTNNTLTTSALQQATNAYQTQQNTHTNAQGRSNRFI